MDWKEIISKLESGELRAASPQGDGNWKVNTEVKEGILAAFKANSNVSYKQNYQGFVDKENLGPRSFSPEDGVRLVPGGSSVRAGSHVAKSVIIMPPAYINIGAFVDEGTMVDSNALVGSCAQIGKNVHLSAGVQIGGVLEPIGMTPVIIEDGAFLGAGSVVVEGIRVGKRAVIAPGVFLSRGVPVFDLVNEKELGRAQVIPDNAVVVAGTRPLGEKYTWGKERGLAVSAAIIVKYRDEKSDASLTLEEFLR